jgi:glycogen debranching enzyme
MSALLQPFIHDQVVCVAAPAVAIFGLDGQIHGAGAQGFYVADRRIISTLVVRLNGHEPEPISCALTRPGAARIVSVHRSGDEPTPDPVVLLEQVRDMRALTERLSLFNHGRCPVTLDLDVEIASDIASTFVIKAGGRNPACLSSPVQAGIRFRDPNGTVTITAQPRPEAESGHLRWRAELDPGATWTVELNVTVEGITSPVVQAGSVPWRRPQLRSGDIRLNELVRQSLDDLEALLVADPRDPQDTFLAAGSPWFLTLFGRDSLWAARMLLPLGTGLAGGTLRALARRQGRRTDDENDEEPGKIPHELRAPGSALPTLSYSTVDATPLFVTLLADAWRWGMPEDEVAALLPAAMHALEWTRSQAIGTGFLRYERRRPGGLSNQGWKDSADAIVHRDGSPAEPPIALPEVQAYAYEAAVRGADLLEAFGRPGAAACRDWAAGLRERFRAAFWAGDHPVLALDGSGRPVDSIASNMGHLLGTGILDEADEAAVASYLGEPVLASGWGLRTLSSASPVFNPLGYHTGSVWVHDTAIAAWGLFRCGHPGQATQLLRGLVDAAPYFGYRLPELFGGEAKVPGHAPLPYPAACRPQAWAAAAAIVLLTVLTGLEPDVPSGQVKVRGAQPAPFGPLDVEGLVIGSSDVAVHIGSDGWVYAEAPGLAVT